MTDPIMEKIKQEHLELKHEIDEFIAGKIDGKELKHASAPFGIYQQKNDKFMVRLRVTGGQLDLNRLGTIAALVNEFKIPYIHITTRQDVQFHDVEPDCIHPLITACTENGMPFRGGGGNTFRNIIACPHSGHSRDTVFDVLPYANALNDYFLRYDKVYELPRKLKIGFSCCRDNAYTAMVQDLGFVARTEQGKPGFTVYGGGGMGRESTAGIKLIDFLPAERLLRCAKAMGDLFYDHGNRSDRNQARIRFIMKRLGEQAFKDLFLDYFGKAENIDFQLSEVDLGQPAEPSTDGSAAITDEDSYQNWCRIAVSQHPNDEAANVILYVPYGNLDLEAMTSLVNLLRQTGTTEIRLTPSQKVLLPGVSKSQIPRVYQFAHETAFDGRSFRGLLVSCIGSTVCKIGILDTPSVADKVATKLDQLFAGKDDEKCRHFADILSSVKFSGCPNTCGAHLLCKVGFQGMKKRIDGELTDCCKVFTDFAKGDDKVTLGIHTEEILKTDDIPNYLARTLDLQ